MGLFSLLEYCMPLLFTMAFAWPLLMGFFSNLILPFHQLGFLFLPTWFSLFANLDLPQVLQVLWFSLSCIVSTLEHILGFTKTVGHCY